MASPRLKVISPEDLMLFRYRHIILKCGQIVMAKVVASCILDNRTKSIKEQLLDLQCQAGGDYKKWLNGLEVAKIEKNEPPEYLDITFLFKICLRFWDKNVLYPGDTLRNLMKKIKDERNKVSHEDLKLTQPKFEQKIREFEVILEDTLTEAKTLYPTDTSVFDQLKAVISEDIRNVLEKIREKLDPSSPEDVRRLKREIDEFFDQLRTDIQKRSKSDLASLYTILCRIRPFDWLPQYRITDPSNIVISLQLKTSKEMHNIRFQEKLEAIDQKEVLIAKEPNGGSPDVVIISGEAGSGKTTLLCSILEKWRKGEIGTFQDLSYYDILLHMEFRKDDVDSFDDYLCDLLPHVVADYGFEIVKSMILRSTCLILCDGYDEENQNSKKLFNDILKLNSNNKKVLITTRPVHWKELITIVNRTKLQCISLSILGTPEESQLSLITNLTNYLLPEPSEKQRVDKQIIKLLPSLDPRMKELMKVPLYLNLFVLIWIECPKIRRNISSLSKLFSTIKQQITNWLKEKLSVLGYLDKDQEILQLENVMDKLSLKNHLCQTHHELSIKDTELLKSKCDELGLPFETVMSTYFNTKISRKNLEIVKVWCFKHRSEQEFGAANAICDEMVRMDQDGLIDFIQQSAEESENVMNYILSSYETEMRPTFSEEGAASPSKDEAESALNDGETERRVTSMKDILVYITGILFHSHKSVLYKCIHDICNIVKLLYVEENENGDLIIDPLLSLLTESDNDSEVTVEVAKALENETDQMWMIKDGNSLSALAALLPKVKPTILSIKLDGDPASYQALIPAIKSTHEHRLTMGLYLYGHYSGSVAGYSDEFIKHTHYLDSFLGALTTDAIRSLNGNLKNLYLRIEMQDLNDASLAISTLTRMVHLCLVIPFYVSSTVVPTEVVFNVEEFWIHIVVREDGGDDSAEKLAEFINSAWPRGRISSPVDIDVVEEESREETDSIWIHNCNFTGDGVMKFLETLLVKDLYKIVLKGIRGITEEGRNRAILKSRLLKNTNLILI